MEAVNVKEKFGKFQDHWSPKIIGELNDCHVKAVKFQGEFVWHHHENEDELFLVVRAALACGSLSGMWSCAKENS